MKFNKFFSLFFYFLFVVNSMSFIFSVSMDISIFENVNFDESGDGEFSVKSKGSLNIYNPSSSDVIYEYGLKFSDKVIFDNKFNGKRLDFYENNILGRNIAPGQKVKFDFEFSGFLPERYVNEILDKNISFFEWYVENIYFSPLKIASIHKMERESGPGKYSRRQVLVTGRNPTEFDVEIVGIKLSKTDSTDYYAFKSAENLLDIFTLNSLVSGGVFNFSTYDEMSDDTSVYWIDYKIDTVNDVKYDFDIDITYLNGGVIDEEDLISDVVEPEYEKALSKVDFRKSFDDSNVIIGTYFDIYLTIINTNNFTLTNLNLFDKIPSNLRLFDRRGNELFEFEVEIDSIKPFETKMFVYELKFYDTSVDLFYLQPAILRFMGDTVYSNSLTLVNDLSASEEKVLVEKTINKYYEGGAEVNLKVENVGDVDLYDLEIIEVLTDLDNLSDNVSVSTNYIPKSWRIPLLEAGEVWEVSYVVLDDETLYYIPDIYGIESSNVFKTTVVNDEVKSAPIDPATSKLVTGLAILGFIIFFVDIMLS